MPKSEGWKNLKPHKKGQGGPGSKPGIRPFASVFRDLLQMTPEEIQKAAGVKLPAAYVNRGLKTIIASKVLVRALKGDLHAFDRIVDRLDGKPKESVALEAKTIIEFIRDGKKAALQAQAEAGPNPTR